MALMVAVAMVVIVVLAGAFVRGRHDIQPQCVATVAVSSTSFVDMLANIAKTVRVTYT